MNPFVRDQIASLRRGDEQSQAQATILEVLALQDETLEEIKSQTQRTNGRVTKLEGYATDFDGRLAAIEAPAKKVKTIWGFSAAVAGGALSVLGVIAALLATPLGEKLFEQRAEVVSTRVVEQIQVQTPPAPTPSSTPSSSRR